MRIVSGKFGSRRIETLTGMQTRPTSDKVRAAIFNRIGPYFNDGAMLDVFGGSGAMSLEAISRGFATAVLIEKHPDACRIIRKNIRNLAAEAQCTLYKGDSLSLLKKLEGSFDLIYVDPPYHYDKIETVLLQIAQRDLLSDQGILIVETDRDAKLASEFMELILDAEKTYGITKIWYYTKRQ